MPYNIKNHGDILERTYSDFIMKNFPTYEKVWQLYIGNIGNDSKAEIQNYPADRDVKRQAFSEHTYTVLQSVILIFRLLEKKCFDKIKSLSIEEKLELQNNILLFFAHIGRIRDNVKAAATCLLNIDIKELEERFDEFWHKRHIPIHGRILPIVYKENGDLEMPVLSKNDEDPAGWNHKINNWPDILSMPIKSIKETTNELFWQMMPLLVDTFGKFEKSISKELSQKELMLKYIFSSGESGISCNDVQAVDVYGINKKMISGKSSTDGTHGSSSYYEN